MGGDGVKDGAKAAPTFSTSAKEQKSHTKLKIRKPEQLLPPPPTKKEADVLLKENSEEDYEDDGFESENDDDEDEELLRQELENIRKEREAQRRREVQGKKIQEQIELSSNPLVPNQQPDNKPGGADEFSVKRRWNDDTIFKVKYVNPEDKKRFINDTTKSDFHRRFMDKYIR